MDTLEGVVRLTTEGADAGRLLSASLDLASVDAIVLHAPTGKELPFPRRRLEPICLEVLSNPFPRLPSLLGSDADPMTGGVAIVNPGSTTALQLVTSLFHLCYALIEQRRLHSDASPSALAQMLYGHRFEDRLPPHNALIVRSARLLELIQAEDVKGKLFQLERLFRCTVEGQDGSEIFYYRPYNTPIVRSGALGEAAALNSALKLEYETIE